MGIITTPTQIYTIGPISPPTNSATYLLMSTVNYVSGNHETTLTIGRGVFGATSGNSVNTAMGFGGLSGPTILSTGTTVTIGNCHGSGTNNENTSVSGFTTDRPGATGISFYYSSWMSSSSNHTYSNMQCILTVLQITP